MRLHNRPRSARPVGVDLKRLGEKQNIDSREEFLESMRFMRKVNVVSNLTLKLRWNVNWSCLDSESHMSPGVTSMR